MINTVIHGDCLEEMKKIPDGSVDAVICDPPYGTTACKWDTVIPLEPMWEQLNGKVRIGEYKQSFTNYPTNIIKIASQRNTVHPTQKPVALMEYLVKTYTNEGETVLDFTAGSGTTGVACKNLNRNYILIEKEQEYVDIINKRLNQ